MNPRPFSWLQIVRLGLVQSALGAIVVITTSTLNRIMVVELALPAALPGALVALHYGMQVLRPRLGHGSDLGGRTTPWIVSGMSLLAFGGFGSAVATAWMSTNLPAGIALAVLCFLAIGIGVGACGTTLLVLLAKRVADEQRAAAATVVWVMMIAGFILTTTIAGHLLDPYSPGRLIAVAGSVSAAAMAITALSIWRVEGALPDVPATFTSPPCTFFLALTEVWNEPRARRFAIFISLSMLAYSAPELILEPFAGSIFGFTPGESTILAGVQHGGTLAGMIFMGIVAGSFGRRRTVSMQTWTIGGCVASAAALVGLMAASLSAPTWPLRPTVFALGLGNGVYAVAAVGSMMSLASAGQKSREGIRMGLWGAAQAIAFGLGGFIGTLAVDIARFVIGSATSAYAMIFAGEASLFLVSAVLAMRVCCDDGKAASRFDHRLAISEAGRG
jgi:MFS transporter, BCD family, chlorophyll transporter